MVREDRLVAQTSQWKSFHISRNDWLRWSGLGKQEHEQLLFGLEQHQMVNLASEGGVLLQRGADTINGGNSTACKIRYIEFCAVAAIECLKTNTIFACAKCGLQVVL